MKSDINFIRDCSKLERVHSKKDCDCTEGKGWTNTILKTYVYIVCVVFTLLCRTPAFYIKHTLVHRKFVIYIYHNRCRVIALTTHTKAVAETTLLKQACVHFHIVACFITDNSRAEYHRMMQIYWNVTSHRTFQLILYQCGWKHYADIQALPYTNESWHILYRLRYKGILKTAYIPRYPGLTMLNITIGFPTACFLSFNMDPLFRVSFYISLSSSSSTCLQQRIIFCPGRHWQRNTECFGNIKGAPTFWKKDSGYRSPLCHPNATEDARFRM
jgi:hypothetical protein